MPSRSLLVDTNPLVLLVVGLADPRQIERFNRTRAYTREDFERLRSFVNGYEELVTTPNIVTETSNLAGQLAEPLRGKALAVLAGLVTLCDERYFESRVVVQEPLFRRLGLTDTAIALGARLPVAVLTDDLPLYGRLASTGAEVFNFNHVRFAAPSEN